MTRDRTATWLTVLVIVALVVGPLVFVDAEFGGADGAAAERIAADHPDYRPWAGPLFEPSAEVASGLFALQAALGAGFLGYYVGVARTKRRLGRGHDAEGDEG